jgi:hypothetical protein
MTMIRRPLHPIVRLLMALLVGSAGAAPALAADVNDVFFTVTIARSSEVADLITAEIRVQGAQLNNGTITFPGAANPTPLVQDGADLALGLEFDSEAQLASLFPAGNYVLRVNNGTVEATIAYEQRPPVPSPDISQPGAGEALPPGALEVLFTKCADCNLTDDSVEARLEDGAANELASETLTSADESWVPPDGMGGDFALPENGEFLVRVTHTAVRAKNVNVTGNDEPIFKFSPIFVQSDEVGFRTGFAPPMGDFCVTVNDPLPAAGCAVLSDPALSLLDTSGVVDTSVAGHDVEYTFTVGPKGDITGNAMADLDDDGSAETAGAIKGKLKGKGGEAKQKLSFPLVSEALAARLKLSVSDELSIPLDSLTRVQKASGSLGGVKVKEETPTGGALPVAPQAWRVTFSIDGQSLVQNAVLTLEQGRSFPLEGSHKFNLKKNLSNLKLQTADKGIKIQLKKVVLDDEAAPPTVVGGGLGYKILGQSGKADVPAPAP